MNWPGEAVLREGSLCVVGNVNRDLKTSSLAAATPLCRDGETSVASIRETVGGGGANCACTAAALGARVALLGKTGADRLGDILEQTLLRHGVAPHLAKDKSCPTGTSINLTFDNGQRHFVSCLPNNQALSGADLNLEILSGYRHLYRADIWFSPAMLFEGNAELFKRASALGMAVSIDLNWDPHWGRAGAEQIRARKNAVRAVLPWVQLAHGNVRELNEFADSPELETTLQRLEGWGVPAVVVHRGSEGAGYYHKGTLLLEPAAPVATRVNTTGTGDVLSVCLMLLHHQTEIPLPAKLKLANRIVSDFIEGKRQLIPNI
jgi:sugar/nucleoside kinase (ribokinase family)